MNENELANRLQTALDLLESIASNRAILANIPESDRARLLEAAGRVSRPDALSRRRLVKAQLRKRKAEKLQRDQSLLGRADRKKNEFP